MQFLTMLRIIGVLLMTFSFSQLPPIFFSWIYQDGQMWTFLHAFFIIFVIGLSLWLAFYRYQRELRTADGFLIVTLSWLSICFLGSLPFVFSENIQASWIDAFFESASGITTTGATVFLGLETFPKSILYYRAQLHFLGGMGIIVLAVAVLPMLGVGGMQLFRAEITGPVKDSKFTPRIKETAKNLWIIYVGMNLCCITLLWLTGMSFFDSICYAFSIVSTGGFAPYDDSLATYAQPDILFISCLFMILSSLNFSLHYISLHRFTLKPQIENGETRWLLFAILVGSLFFWYYLSEFVAPSEVLSYFWRAFFQVVSAITTTGLTVENFSIWPQALPLVLLLLAVIGGCAGSTTGGIKFIRVLLLSVQASREVKKLIHPNGKFPLKLDKKVVPDRVADAVWGFIAMYAVTFTTIFVALMFCDLDLNSAYSGTVAMIANLGTGLGSIALDYSQITTEAKFVMSLAMIVGRLEIFTVLVILMPAFWRR